MSLYAEWEKAMTSQTDDTIQDFWKKYSGTEKKIYQDILANYTVTPEGKIGDMIAKYEADPVIFMGFLDGINSSLKQELDLDKLDEESEIKLDIDLEKLLFNMYKADAQYLYELPEWLNIFPEEKIEEIHKSYKNSRTVHRTEAKIGRNDPCPCGSGKKYKNCCGKN